MAKRKAVTIDLTPDQRKKIKVGLGEEVRTLKVEALEDRVAPSIIRPGKQIKDPELEP
jgi:hypothetical protein